MDKNLIFLGVLVVGLGGAVWYQHQPKASASTVAVAAGKAGAAPVAPGTPEALQQQAAQQAARTQIENALRPMKVTSLLLGEPAIVIIDKEEYSVGSPLKVPGGKVLQVTGINENGVALAWSGQTFHLDAPAAPDLAASRKKR